MKFSYLLPFAGLAQAVPAANSFRPSTLDNPTTPVGDQASLEDLPGLSHIRRATQPTLLNVAYCDVNVNGDGGFYTSWKAQNTRGQLYITQAIPSHGTKNGANLYEVYLQGGASSGAGSIRFTSNSNLLSLPLKIGSSNIDYAKVSMSSDGHIVAQVDYSNIDKPANSPLVFYSEPSIGNMVYGPLLDMWPLGYLFLVSRLATRESWMVLFCSAALTTMLLYTLLVLLEFVGTFLPLS